ncbi:glycosyltransferase family protein [Lacticaseibacillus paracasei]|jgi:integral membrane protein (TIGR03766 family)|uniref:hypothetical protein n=1 Tax=Lacticaseibacillus paracasei TaxID=1597 RepID=UPI000F0B0162|nr:hypothetical protein [Lacticaseibacillus paracasei]MBB1168549.1 hypothetical protein [Lacticaseibacillus paracasei]MCT3343376.1 hypothetical protein [Lacticaseibacillus paracasei]RND50333.1 hypothetical protein FAM18113_02822 [Lacticaseibacillus paracasei]RNE07390.1 hypothetical protein FAM22278_01449 [Lacticaseibacillus paracasei]TEA87569.1 hypothetical protein TK35_10885 [Lacticaseibacillus paracasei]
MRKLFNGYHNFIRLLIFPLFFLTVFGSIRAEQLDLTFLSHWFFSVIIFLAVVVATLYYFRDKSKIFFSYVYKILLKHITLVVCASMIVVAALQIIILLNTRTPIGWDVGAVMKAVIRPKSGAEYVSINPNNLFLISIYHGIYQLFLSHGSSLAATWLFFQIVTAIELDFSVICIVFFTYKVFNRKVALNTYLLFFFLFVLTPYIQTPYSDIAVLVPISLGMLCFAGLETTVHTYLKVLFAVLIGFLFVIVYEIKPSGLILLVAWTIDALTRELLNNDNSRKKVNLILVLFVVLSFAGGQNIATKLIETHSPIPVVKDRGLPWQHFVLIGMTGNGGYNSPIRHTTLDFVTTKKMAQYSSQQISKRLNTLGFVSYLQFLAGKQIRNTDRGDFSWGQEGIPQPPFNRTKGSLQDRIRSVYLIGGRHQADMSFYYQVVWLLALVGILLSLVKVNPVKDKWVSILILSMLGAFLYLLLFEGGRSRYLIQYLPTLMPLSAWGWYVNTEKNIEN